MPTLLLADAEYAVRQWERGLTDLTALVNGRVDLHEPRSPDAPHVILTRIGGGPEGVLRLDRARMQHTCVAPNGAQAMAVAVTLATALLALPERRTEFVNDSSGVAYCYGVEDDLTITPGVSHHPKRRSHIVTATFRLSPT